MSEAIGLILRIDAKVCHVDVGGRSLRVPLRGRLFEERGHARNPVAVGDRVRLSAAEDPEHTAIEEVLPRTTKLARRAKGEEEREQVLAANVSLVLVVAAVREPPLQPVLIDRILASCERQELRGAVVLTKLDRDRHGAADEWIALYRGLGYEVFPTSIATGCETAAVLERLATELHGNVTVLAGLSGVGKSSLINHLIPGLDLRIGSMNRIRQGKHTTTHAQLVPLPGGGHVLDTPGIRNFALFGVDPAELSFYFREIRDLATGCAYRDCAHQSEPDCAVRRALDEGRIHPSRYASFVTIHRELVEAEQ
ncbi:MAG: ribosome small subunit-dependent GTPase A [Planctomycetes bacterium]|nr:ribosome small subunit-dependent GTPase A [Planctomycetota bacterium]